MGFVFGGALLGQLNLISGRATGLVGRCTLAGIPDFLVIGAARPIVATGLPPHSAQTRPTRALPWTSSDWAWL